LGLFGPAETTANLVVWTAQIGAFHGRMFGAIEQSGAIESSAG
jgi:hypothetical protein